MGKMTEEAQIYLNEFIRVRPGMTVEDALKHKIVRGIVAEKNGEEFDWYDDLPYYGKKAPVPPRPKFVDGGGPKI